MRTGPEKTGRKRTLHMKILISGSKGQLGTELQRMLAAGQSELGPLPH